MEAAFWEQYNHIEKDSAMTQKLLLVSEVLPVAAVAVAHRCGLEVAESRPLDSGRRRARPRRD